MTEHVTGSNKVNDAVRLSEPHGQLFFSLQFAAHRLRKVADQQIIKTTNLTATQASVLYVVATGVSKRQSGIADFLGQNESAITATVSVLIRKSFLSRHRDPKDGRAFILAVEPAGLAELAKSRMAFEKLDEIMDQNLSADEIAHLTSLLIRLSNVY